MVILFPISVSDRHHAPSFLKLLQEFGPYPEDKAIILPTPSAYYDPALRPVVDGIQALFSHENCKIELTQNDFGSTWPYAPGCHFKFAMEVLDQLGPDWRQPTLWMEPDFMPIQSGWLKMIKDDYQMASNPFRGMLEKTRYIDTALIKQPDGTFKMGTRTPRYDGTIHLVGAGIYPAGYIQYLTPAKEGEKGSPMASYRNPSSTIPFDVKCQDQHVPASQSPLMVHKPRTINWRRVNGDIFTCEDRSPDEFGLTYAGPVNLKGVCLVHGCKDDSLAKAILEGIPQGELTFTEVEESTALNPTVTNDGATVSAPMPLGNTEESREDILTQRIQDLEEQNQMLQEQCQSLAQAKYGLEMELAVKPSRPMEEEPEPSQVPERRKLGRPKGSGKVKPATAA